MRTSADRILTTHVGSLQTPDYIDPDKFGQITEAQLRAAVGAVVEDQKAAGVDTIDEGELTRGGIWSMAEGASIASKQLRGHA